MAGKGLHAEDGVVAIGKPCGRPLGSTKKPKVSLIGTLEMLDTMKKVSLIGTLDMVDKLKNWVRAIY